ncbi:AraC family transcriptional regulator [Saccharicrinis aurantiacus]|uniref:AraC family transcriptional regulator n=1 Tax=Saccharicrinis aurantiacus TaxID=1849719 RepID=UPI002493C646|nr:AraC family transcriptional regulator [Saccharicrinis aurantiacus]
MKDFFKYLTVSNENKNWGLFLNVAGQSFIPTHVQYPSSEHPSSYYFKYENGRILNEYQLNYITNGSGIFETKEESFKVEPGTLMIIRKQQWHRYKPDNNIGWTEHYIGFDGPIADHFLQQKSVLNNNSVISLGMHEELIDTYYKIFHLVQEEKPGFQEISSGLIIKLLGYIVAAQKQQEFRGGHIEVAIQKLRFEMRKEILQLPDLTQWASSCNVSYDYFRTMFKKYTGISPHQYHLELKILRAKELLLTTDKSIKEISYELDFQSIHYFSRLFKKKMGQSPSLVRTL